MEMIMTRATKLGPWPVSGSTGLFASGNGTGPVVNANTALTVTALYCGIKILGETLGQLPLSVFLEGANGGKGQAKDHPLWKILHTQPNSDQTSSEFIEMMTAWAAFTGNAYAEIVVGENSGRVNALWPIMPNDLQRVTRGVDEEAIYHFNDGEGHQRTLPGSRVLHLRGFNTGGFFGDSLLTHFAQVMGLSISTEELESDMMDNGAVPNGVVEMDKTMSEPAQDRFKKGWKESHGGRNKGSVAVLEDGLKYKQVSLSPTDIKLLESKQFRVLDYARMLRIPPHFLMNMDAATFGNIEHQDIEFVKYTIQPWVIRFEARFNISLLTEADRERGYFTKFNLNGLLRGDTAARAALYKELSITGTISPDEIRAKEDMNPQPGGIGEVYQRPLNTQFIGPGAKPPPAVTPPKTNLTRTKFERATVSPTERRDAALRRDIALASQDPWGAAILALLKQERAAIMKVARKELNKRDVSTLTSFIRSYYLKRGPAVAKMMRPNIFALSRQIQTAAAAEIDFDGSFDEDFTNEFLDGFVQRHIDFSAGQILGIVESNEEVDIEPALNNMFDSWIESDTPRSESSAREESNRLSGGAAVAMWVIGGITVKRWVTFGKSCPMCNNLNGTVVGIEKDFYSKGDTVPNEGGTDLQIKRSNIGTNPLHDGCDCQIVAGG